MTTNYNQVPRGRARIFQLLLSLVFFLLIGRFAYLQLFQHSRYQSKAKANRIREMSRPGPRGLIFDRHGELLVDNRFTYTVSAIPWEVKQNPRILTRVSTYLDQSKSQLQRTLREQSRSVFLPVRLATELSFSTFARLQEHRLELPGILLSSEPIRHYPSEAFMSHTLGYLREISERQLAHNQSEHSYRSGDLVGWNGLEKAYESVLRGKKGYEYVQVNAVGQVLGPVEDQQSTQPRPGHNLYVSLDAGLQTYTESLFDTLQGAAVLLNAKSGAIYTLVSAPDYDLSTFSGAVDSKAWNAFLSDTTRPLLNRAVAGTYPPGSTFKLITAIAALEENMVTPEWTVTCPGYYRLGRRRFRCWKVHGRINMYQAIAQSCNVYFYTLIRKVGIQRWAKYARLFGFGNPTGIDLPEESPGILPDKQWMDRRYGRTGWTEGNLLNMAVGQGDVLVTPVQMAHFVGILATEGLVTVPHLGTTHGSGDGVLTEADYQKYRLASIDSSTFRIIKNGMRQAVNGTHGTARAAGIPTADILGKTGTAQNPHGEDHAWFIGILEGSEELLAIAVLAENGGSGGRAAAPIAGKILRKYRQLSQSRNADAQHVLLQTSIQY